MVPKRISITPAALRITRHSIAGTQLLKIGDSNSRDGFKVTALSASSGCLRLLCGSQGDESETDDSDNGEAEQIVA
jgi:hypothetical protein